MRSFSRTFGVVGAAALLMQIGSAGALTLKPGTVWPTSEIKVCWEDTSRDRRQERDLIRKSVRWTWETESAVSFTGWRKCRPGDTGVRISFDSTYPRTEGRGRELDGVPSGVHLPTLWSLAALSINMKAPVHEFGHVLGFGHEYARADVEDRARCGADLNGAPYIEDDKALTPYDEYSIMVGCRPGATRRFSSGVPSLSAGDIFGLVRVYGSHPDNILDDDEAGDLFGAALVAVDLNGDDVPDLAVGAPGEDAGRGAIYLYTGHKVKGFRPWMKLAAPDGAEGFGTALPDASPVIAADGGMEMRLLVSAASNPQSAYAYHLSAPNAPIETVDLANSSAEPITAQQPQPSLATFAEDLGREQPKTATAVLVDLNEDGLPEVVTGRPEASVDGVASGAVVVFRGLPDGTFAEWYWFGQQY